MNDDHGYTNATNTSTTSQAIDVESLARIVRKFDRIRQKQLRRAAQLSEDMVCQKCGRRPIWKNSGFGDTMIVCRHIWDVIRARCEHVPKLPGVQFGIPVKFGGIAIVLDDGPALW